MYLFVLCTTHTGISGQFPSEYVTAVVSGQALGGVFTAFIEIMTITFASDPRGSAVIFFTIGNILLVLSVVAYILMTRTVFFRYYTAEKSVPKTNFARLQRQPSIREPIFREVLNKMWLYGFTEWLVSVRVKKELKVLIIFEWKWGNHDHLLWENHVSIKFECFFFMFLCKL